MRAREKQASLPHVYLHKMDQFFDAFPCAMVRVEFGQLGVRLQRVLGLLEIIKLLL